MKPINITKTDIKNAAKRIANMQQVIIVDNKQSLSERLVALKALRDAEKQGENDKRYIDDLNLSIAMIERQMK